MALENITGPAALVLTATVARRYYLDGASKSDIAAELGLSRFKVARMLDRALATGLVRIEIDSQGEINLDLSVRLSAAYGLRHCIVLDAPEDDDTVLRAALGRAAADLLAEIIEPGDVLGLAWARSLMAMRTSLARLPRCDVVQLTGSLSLPADESPIELVRDVARRSDGQAFFFYAPMMLPDAATARVLRTQPEIARAIATFPHVTKAVVGIGAWRQGLSTVADALSQDERQEIYDLGVRSELSGIQLDEDGNPVITSLTDRLIGIDAERLHAVPEVIAIAYGAPKADAVKASIRGGFVTSLVTHTAMASELLRESMTAMPDSAGEVVLHGGFTNAGHVRRVGQSVRRPWRSTSPATKALLDHLERAGFDGAPRFLGVDERGREMLSFIPGEAAIEPHQAWALTDAALVSVAALLRRYHDAVASFEGADHDWPQSVPAAFRAGLISHNDPNLDNVVFSGGRAVALIDFDLAGPGSAVWDVACAARLWAPLRDERDVPEPLRGRSLGRLRMFVDAYGLPARDRSAVVDAMVATHDWCYRIVRGAVGGGHEPFGRMWREGGERRAERTRAWLAGHGREMRAAMGNDVVADQRGESRYG